MKVIQIPDPLYDYLLHVIEAHASSGIHPEEGLALNQLWISVKERATHVDDIAIRKMAEAGAPKEQALSGEI